MSVTGPLPFARRLAATLGDVRWLAFLLAGVLLADTRWLWSGPNRDPWIYYGYFQNGLDLLRSYPHLYYSSRLSVTMPGWVLHHALPAGAANVILHLTLWLAAVGGLAIAARALTSRRAAWLVVVVLGTSPHALKALGWNMTDGFGLAYFGLAAALLVVRPSGRWRSRRAAQEGRRRWPS